MSEVYKLPGSSYEEIVKIIRAYSSSKNGTPLSLGDLAQLSGMDKTIISRNNGFLMQTKIITEGAKKAATETGLNLGRAYALGINEQIVLIWNEIVKNDDFLNRMISTIQIKGEMSKQDFVNHIVFSSSNNNTNGARAGAAAIIEILKLTQLIEEKDGLIVAGRGDLTNGSMSKASLSQNETDKCMPVDKRSDTFVKDSLAVETGYYIQTYTCESGKAAKFIIPEDATEDDLLAFSDMLNIVLKRKFKIKI